MVNPQPLKNTRRREENEEVSNLQRKSPKLPTREPQGVQLSAHKSEIPSPVWRVHPRQKREFQHKTCVARGFRTAPKLERVGRSRHRRCDPGRAHRLLHPRVLESNTNRKTCPKITLSSSGADEKQRRPNYYCLAMHVLRWVFSDECPSTNVP
jgi:hypothetical protein